MNYIVVSNRWLSDYGLTNEDIIGYCHYDIFPNIPERWKEVHQRCLQGASESNDEETFLRADGTINWIRWDILPWYSTNGGIGGIIIFTEDITKRKESEEIRYELMNRNEALVKALGEIVYDWRPPEDRLTWEGDYTRILGYTPDEIGTVTASWEERIHPDDLPDVLAEVENAIRQHRNFEFEYQFRRKDGSYCWMNDRGVSYFDEQGKLTRMIGVFSDISQRKKIEEDLIKSEQSLRNLVTRLQEVREEERTHISREIHDELGQSLTGIRIDLSWILDQLSEEKEDLINRAKMAILLADQTIDSVQRLSLDLRPLILDDLGLQAAVEWHINEFIRRTDCQCNLDLKLNGIVFDDKHATAIFRILQEALTNVSRHAGATEVNISLQVNDGQFFMDIFDNGCGIETKEMNSSESIGLTGMRERADAIGAHIEFLKHYSGGTHVRLKLSVEPAREATT